jgi:two-component system osmolarity sensor histidine kinase EnvZ
VSRWNRLIRPQTLLGRTAQALALAFLLFALFASALLQFTLVRPHTRQAADDLAAFLVLAAQIWVELPPYTRPDYEKELLDKHELKILPREAPRPRRSDSHSYLGHLQTALSEHIGQPVFIHRHPDYPGWLWADFPMGERIMHLGFRKQRLQGHVFMILPFLAIIGLFVAFALSLVLVRRITRPLAAMAEATHRIGAGDFSASIPETGPREIADLARKLNQMEAEVGQLLENRTTLLAGISHDLRTPLARMRLELELLRETGSNELIEGLHHDISEMEKLISQALLLARGLGHEREIETDVNALLGELAEDFRRAGNEVDFQPTQSCIHALKVEGLKRVLGNLVDNAVRYGGGTRVTLECEKSGSGIDIRVIDNGPGIPPEQREAIFQPFHRLEGSRNKATGGSGLGLAIVRQLCQANAWRIEVSSSSRGGSVFELHLPATDKP